MDFFKGCKTNVWQTENIWETPITIYQYNREHRYHEIQGLVSQLRKQNILCTVEKPELWLFGVLGSDAVDLLQSSGLALRDQSTLASYASQRTASGGPVKNALLDAMEGAVAFRLSAVDSVDHVGPRTWLLNPYDRMGSSKAVQLRLRLEFTDPGMLYATATLQPSSLSPLCEIVPETVVLLAPIGCRAEFAIHENTSRSLAESDSWKHTAIARLQAEGTGVDMHEQWVPVLSLDGEQPESFIWPARLCFVHSAQVARDREWKTFFTTPSEEDGLKHPLTVVEDWFTGAADRQAIADGLISEATNAGAALPTSTPADGENIALTSPPFVQRTADQQLAASGIYPTPPDGLVQGQPASQQPSSDNVMAGITYNDASNFEHDFMPSNDDLPRQSNSSDSNALGLQHGSDDLFGDASGEMDFATGEIGDEDFDFFNEEDAVTATALEEDSEMVEVEHHDVEAGHMDETEEEPLDDVVAATPLIEEEHAEPMQPEVSTECVTDTLPQPTHDYVESTEALVLHEQEKPLSPFGIKERLLPPPIPASTIVAQSHDNDRRSSTFEPMAFRENLEIGGRYSAEYGPGRYIPQQEQSQVTQNISLPPKQKKPRALRPTVVDTEAGGPDSESEEDSYESESSLSDADMPPRPPWMTKKRKRDQPEDLQPNPELELMLAPDDRLDRENECRRDAELAGMLERVLVRESRFADDELTPETDVMESLRLVETVHPLTKLDLVYTAQLVSEQAVSCMPAIVKQLDLLSIDQHGNGMSGPAAHSMADLLEQLLPNTNRFDVTELALTRDPPNRATPATRPGQPRPPIRADTANLGPDIVAVQPPFVRVQRGNDTYEMLPPALSFWETLSLAPTNGQKDVRAYCVYPHNEELQRLTDTFLSDLSTMYENCKLGSHVYIRNVNESDDEDEYEDGLASVELDDDDSIEGAVKAYAETCTNLGRFLATVGSHEADRTIVVYMLNPFSQDGRVRQHLCACFWLLCKAYRDHTPQAQRGQPQSDVALQLLPIELVASPDGLVILDFKQLGALAKEVYDRCPPASDSDHNNSSALPNFAAPLVELASPPPKRLGFQLVAEPPSDLLHEGSALHLAYALSSDRKWLTAAWTDNTGRYQSSTSYCMRGRTFADVAAEVWEATRDIVAARDVTWRIFILAAAPLNDSYKNCWRNVIARPRKQPFSVTLLSAQPDLDLQMSPPAPTIEDATITGAVPGGAGWLTPGSTPQATSGMTTVSPDPNGNNHNVPPPTPAPSDAATALAESDPDAHLIDLADESWVVLFSPTIYPVAISRALMSGLSHGALFKRGVADQMSTAALPCLGVSLLWTVQVRPNGNVDDGNVKQTEMTLREVLRMYRGLSVLTRARGLAGEDGHGQCWPVHLVGAVRGAEALGGYL
ncbi:mediator of RNA polymerase II transcription subunit 13 [Elasticomyces elasticus]|nr:mediator of RNA polymerase II transcription subunit 13 [Elasticomyces elasticus]KAK4976716.1 mediator of RNA polymerase II transcription subunit 13 [Elasticomyces elasticus]